MAFVVDKVPLLLELKSKKSKFKFPKIQNTKTWTCVSKSLKNGFLYGFFIMIWGFGLVPESTSIMDDDLGDLGDMMGNDFSSYDTSKCDPNIKPKVSWFQN